ncbi:MAG: hypothetical protein QM692_08125 [Thermomicrobiales bacterium]
MEQADAPDREHIRHPVEREIRQSLAPVLAQAGDIRAWALQAPELGDAERAAILLHVDALERTARQFVEVVMVSDSPSPLPKDPMDGRKKPD